MDDGFLTNWWRDAWTLIGTIASILGAILSVAGLAWTLVQVYKLRSTAEAARLAAEEAKQQSRMAFQRYAVSNGCRYIAEAKEYFSARRWELTAQRLVDLIEHSRQLANAAKLAEDDESWTEVANSLRKWELVVRQLGAFERGDEASKPKFSSRRWDEMMQSVEARFHAHYGPFVDL